MQLRVIYYDGYGVAIDSFVGAPEDAARDAARFILLHGADPDENGADAQAGSVVFEPVK